MVVVFVGTGLVLSACAGGADQALTPTAGPQSDFDQMFIDMMVPHHQAAVEMARIAQEQAEHPEIQQMADRIIEDQEIEVEQLQTWRQAWFGSSSTPLMSEMPMLPGMTQMEHGAMTMDMTEDVEMLRTTPAPFDRMFIDLMIGHHQMAIDDRAGARLDQRILPWPRLPLPHASQSASSKIVCRRSAVPRRTIRTIQQNQFWAFFYNVTLFPEAALGYLVPIWRRARWPSAVSSS